MQGVIERRFKKLILEFDMGDIRDREIIYEIIMPSQVWNARTWTKMISKDDKESQGKSHRI